MESVKLSITCRKRLLSKYDAQAMARIDAAVAKWIAADKARGIRTVHVAIDDAKAMKDLGAAAVKGRATANKVKRALDALAGKLKPEYIVLFGTGDVVPHFLVANPSSKEDDEDTVPTDNPYASSQPFRARDRASYLVPDRVVGRIPDVVGDSDPAWLVDYLGMAHGWESATSTKYAKALLVCCDTWKNAGAECTRYIQRKAKTLMISPPTGVGSSSIRGRHSARIHMIKCHGSGLDSRFYGQKGEKYPVIMESTSLLGRVKPGTVAAAMCCYGASIFDPNDPAAISPGSPPIPSVYLRQGALGFLGSTNTAWVGDQDMQCADWVVGAFIKSVLGGASLGRATLEAKQNLLQWIQQQGNDPDAAEEKTLLQFMLLGDPSMHPVKAASPAGVVRASLAGTGTSSGVVMARRARRESREQLGAMLRESTPRTTAVRSARVPANINALARKLAAPHAAKRLSSPRVERLVHGISSASRGPGRVMAAALPRKRESLQYYWTTERGRGRIRDIRLVSIQADTHGTVLRAQVVVSS